MEYGYRVKFHTQTKAVTVLMILPYRLEESLCAGILDDWLAFKVNNGERIQCQISTGKRKAYRPLPKEKIIVDRVSVVTKVGLQRERQSIPIVSLNTSDLHFISKKRLSTIKS
ncbi:hypothetical protein [Listeria goaensis]|uniref:hypothetical protein n=1 Tax=Listeria goaensis TaxID=1649188 RepID=UPI000B592AB8|nr:hypothetical protein [Listeria goaensis]